MIRSYYQESPRKWYTNPVFPLVPLIYRRPANEHNTAGFSFHWLFVKFWLLDHFDFEIALVCSTHWGLGIIGILPYLRWAVAIPCPYAIDEFLHKYFHRKPPVLNNHYKPLRMQDSDYYGSDQDADQSTDQTAE